MVIFQTLRQKRGLQTDETNYRSGDSVYTHTRLVKMVDYEESSTENSWVVGESQVIFLKISAERNFF